MQAEYATKKTTLLVEFKIGFDKKALKEQALSAATAYGELRHSMLHPLMCQQLKQVWRSNLIHTASRLGKDHDDLQLQHDMNILLRCVEDYAALTETRRPALTVSLLEQIANVLSERLFVNDALEAWLTWVNGDACMNLAPEYRALIGVYYLQMVHPISRRQACMNMAVLTYLLRCTGLGDAAEGVAYYFCADEHRLTKVFMACQKAQHKKHFQTQWILHYLSILQQFLSETKKLMQKKYNQALFDQARYCSCLNERQNAIIDQLILNKAIRDKKSLFNSSFYRALYIKQSRRTQERDFKSLCDSQLIIIQDHAQFLLAIDGDE